MNLYHGSGGRREYRPDGELPRPSPLPPQTPPAAGAGEGAEKKTPPGPLHSLGRGLDGILSRLDPGRLETEDLLVLAILWLLYRESGDRELLIALGLYLFL